MEWTVIVGPDTLLSKEPLYDNARYAMEVGLLWLTDWSIPYIEERRYDDNS